MLYQIYFMQLKSLIFATKHFDQGTPNRWTYISRYVTNNSNSDGPALMIGEKNGKCVTKIFNSEDERMCKLMSQMVSEKYPCLEEVKADYEIFAEMVAAEKNGFKSIILKSPFKECIFCKEHLHTISKPSFPFIYTENGVFIAASYTSECRLCDTKPRYNNSFYNTNVDDRKTKRFYSKMELGDSDKKYFLCSSQTGFSKNYLKLCSEEIRVMGASFESLTEVFNNFHSKQVSDYVAMKFFKRVVNGEDQSKLNPQRLEEAWFLYRIVSLIDRECIEVERRDSGLLNIEKLCGDLEEEFEKLQESWVSHKCDVKGCSEGYCTIDGNEKLRRSICSKGGEKVNTEEGLTIRDVCISDPEFGGKYKKPMKFCTEHKFENDTNIKDGEVQGDSNVRSLRKRKCPFSSQDLEDGDLAKISKIEMDTNICKDKTKVNKFYDTTSGMLFAIRPCGVIVSFCEMFTHESLTQAFLFLRKVFCKSQFTLSRLNYLGYDRACELKPFISKLANMEVLGANELLISVEFLVDIFHVTKHTKKCCMPLVGNPKCLFHPHLDIFKPIHGTNTESCEQAFKKLNRYKYSSRMLTRSKRTVFFTIICHDQNSNK